MSLYIRTPKQSKESTYLTTKTSFLSAKVLIPCEQEIHVVHIPNIIYCQANSNYCQLYLEDGKSIYCSKTLKKIEGNLPDKHFFRVHRSYVINILKIVSVGTELELEGGIYIPIARNRRKELIERLTQLYPSIN